MKNIIYKIKYPIRYLYRYLVYPKLLNIRHRDTLIKNLELKNSQKGKRCFIVGGGPSIASIDFKKLKSEHVFVVNNFISHPQFEELRAKYYLLIDTASASSTHKDDFWGRDLKNKSQALAYGPIVFLNIVSQKLVRERALFSQNDVHYLAMNGIMSNNFKFNVNIDKTIPNPKNVVLCALMIAVYMGFEEIYLLGCEHDFLAYPHTTGVLKVTPHGYKDNLDTVDLNEIKDIKEYKRDIESNYEDNIANALQLFKNYRLFRDRAKEINPNINIYNATPKSFLDVFPSVSFEDINLS